MVLFEKYGDLLEKQFNKRFDNVLHFTMFVAILTCIPKDRASG